MQRMRMMPVLLNSHRKRIVRVACDGAVVKEQLLYDESRNFHLQTSLTDIE